MKEPTKEYFLIDLCKCKYCGSYITILNDTGSCPRGCPGNMTIIRSTLFNKDEKGNIMYMRDYLLIDDEYENMRKEIGL